MSVCWTVLLVLSFCQPGTVQTVQDQTGGKRDHFFYWNPLSVYFPLAVYYVKTDRKISDDQIAFKAIPENGHIWQKKVSTGYPRQSGGSFLFIARIRASFSALLCT